MSEGGNACVCVCVGMCAGTNMSMLLDSCTMAFIPAKSPLDICNKESVPRGGAVLMTLRPADMKNQSRDWGEMCSIAFFADPQQNAHLH